MRFRELFVLGSGVLTLLAVFSIIGAIAFLGGGHPPASGIVAVLIFFAVTPFSLAASVIGLVTPPRRISELKRGGKLFFISTGVCFAFTVFAAALLFVKAGLGRAV
jgi:hypothetical protein